MGDIVQIGTHTKVSIIICMIKYRNVQRVCSVLRNNFLVLLVIRKGLVYGGVFITSDVSNELRQQSK